MQLSKDFSYFYVAIFDIHRILFQMEMVYRLSQPKPHNYCLIDYVQCMTAHY